MYYLRRIVQNPIYITLCDTLGYYVAVLLFGSLVGIMEAVTVKSSFYLGMMLLGVGSIIYVGKEDLSVTL